MAHLDEFLAGKYSLDGYKAACQADWEQGEPIEVGDDGNGMGPAVDGHRWIGYVGTTAGDRQLHDFRAVPTDNPRRRRVFAIDADGRAFYVGMLARRVRYSRNPHTVIHTSAIERLRQPHPAQEQIDKMSAEILTRKK